MGWIALSGMLIVSLWFNTLFWEWLKTGKMSFESAWNVAISQCEQRSEDDDLLYIFPNLIEDRALSPAQSSPDSNGLSEYCLFPINGIYQSSVSEQIPRSTLLRPRFGLEDLIRLHVGRRVFLLIRGNHAINSDILNEFAEFGIRNEVYIRSVNSELFEIRGVPDQFISLFEFEIFAKPDDDPHFKSGD